MTPGERQAITERARCAIACAQELAGRSAETRAIAAELTVIADDICSRTRAERERARLLARERDRTDPAAVRLGARAHKRAVVSGTQLRLVVTAEIVSRALSIEGPDRLMSI